MVALVKVAIVDALSEDLAVIYDISKSLLEQHFDLYIFDRTALHGKLVIFSIYPDPINDFTKPVLQNVI